MRVVISGPMSIRPNLNFPAFDQAEELLARHGWEAVSPARISSDEGWVEVSSRIDGSPLITTSDTFDYETAIKHMLFEIERADGVVMLSGWTQSPGALREREHATKLGKRVFYLLGTSLWEAGPADVLQARIPLGGDGDGPCTLPVEDCGCDYHPQTAREEEISGNLADPKRDLLDEAARLVTSDRNNTYGPPSQDFTRTAALWSIIFEPLLKEGVTFQAHHVAMAMIQLKQSRLVWSPGKRDNWTDSAGYAACGWDCVAQ